MCVQCVLLGNATADDITYYPYEAVLSVVSRRPSVRLSGASDLLEIRKL